VVAAVLHMRRADRLFQIIQLLRRSKSPTTARALATELAVSVRSVYRDIADLIRQGIPIRGEAGVGYVMDRGYDMPPLMLTPSELEAAVLGAQWVMERADPQLAHAARDLISKIASSVPQHLRGFLAEPTVGTPANNIPIKDGLCLSKTRDWIRQGRKLRLQYRDEQGVHTERTIWPVMIGFTETVHLLAGWCELRQGFRHFRTDRIVAAGFLNELCALRPQVLRRRWEHYMEQTRRLRLPTTVDS
jgi:predicted DNA-binding transcriptional regulator YafY